MCLKIGENLEIQITYKILQLGFLFLGFLPCFERRLFLAIFMKNRANSLGINNPQGIYVIHLQNNLIFFLLVECNYTSNLLII